jgi:hypothetical protein
VRRASVGMEGAVTHLVVAADKDVDHVRVGGGTLGQGLVVLLGDGSVGQSVSQPQCLCPTRPARTLDAFLRYLALSLSMSWCERNGSLSSLLITIPGPCVHGPPQKRRMRAPVLGKRAWYAPTHAHAGGQPRR